MMLISVTLTGIEPISKEPESSILSIKLQSRNDSTKIRKILEYILLFIRRVEQVFIFPQKIVFS